jgi:hypothetical protein
MRPISCHSAINPATNIGAASIDMFEDFMVLFLLLSA